ncbi:MAG: hypothetical protein VKJ04_05925, partial [Vampirovibrionales bacterium]|nr:hypothetical protein [Vampirovibrionales bacterium]
SCKKRLNNCPCLLGHDFRACYNPFPKRVYRARQIPDFQHLGFLKKCRLRQFLPTDVKIAPAESQGILNCRWRAIFFRKTSLGACGAFLAACFDYNKLSIGMSSFYE